jgi:hypothetical protein
LQQPRFDAWLERGAQCAEPFQSSKTQNPITYSQSYNQYICVIISPPASLAIAFEELSQSTAFAESRLIKRQLDCFRSIAVCKTRTLFRQRAPQNI